METLTKLARILRYSPCCSRMRKLKTDILSALATERPTDDEILVLIQRAQSLRIIRGGDIIL